MSRLITLVLVGALVACHEQRDKAPTAPMEPGAALDLGQSQEGPRTPDDEMAVLADSTPGFGGWFIDESGHPTLVLREPGQAAAISQQLAPRIARAILRNAAELGPLFRIRQGEYDFRQLLEWSRAADAVLNSEPSAVFVDADEAKNRVTVGIADAGVMALVRQRLTKAGVPDEALNVIVVGRVENMTQLGDRVRPMNGGIIARSPASGNGCTMGFTATKSVFGPMGFVTASHCTATFGSATTPETFGQPNMLPQNQIGVEILDPSPWQNTTECTAWRWFNPNGVCRYSDAAMIDFRYVSHDSVEFGYVARTLIRGGLNVPGSVTIDPNKRRFEVASKWYSVPTGAFVEFVGRNTGWTVHQVSNSCVTLHTTQANGTPTKLWCTIRTTGAAQGGDSGGPAFGYDYCDSGQLERPDGTKCIRLAGTLIGGSGSNVYFSSIWGIEQDMGLMHVRPADKPYP